MNHPKPILSGELEPLAAQFYAECARGGLAFQRCTRCATWRHLPRHACAACGSPSWRWERASGRGRLFSWTITHRAPHPAFAAATPYVVAVVELEEGVRMVAALRGVEPGALRLDLPLVVGLERVSETAAVPFFRPAP
jgi:uncharacterized OB-fold protein